MDFQLVTGYENFSRSEACWLEMEKVGGVRTPFQSFAWIEEWLQHRGRDIEPFVVIIEGSILAPFGISKVGGFRTMRLLGTPDSDYPGLVTALSPHTAWDSVIRVLSQLRSYWDLLHLHSVQEREAVTTALKSHIKSATVERLYEVCPVIKTDLPWDVLLAQRKNIRNNLKRWKRRLAEIGTIRIQVVKPPVSDAILSELVQLEQASWKWDTGNTTFKPGSWCDFITGILKNPRMQFELWLLRLSEKLVGMELVLIAENRWYCYMAISRKDCPNAGAYLLSQVIETACSCDCQLVDLMRGGEEYKYAWTDVRGEVYEIIAPINMRGYLIAMGYYVRWRAAKYEFFHSLRNKLTGKGDRRFRPVKKSLN